MAFYSLKLILTDSRSMERIVVHAAYEMERKKKNEEVYDDMV